nr:nuclear pore complex protein Nup50-like isoform X4 [Misgurnus anguillicaudatus]XP_055046921.1 nuclear pore complex protein Nup50-like isoform X4 [Misgurnus anguillicaudatus]XP_055046922.1 nuclear pore complex protein Nup50-like isoform X4 [Misgurnus anguillicaudatus]XP_055046923.1 nuclear pore complex protein Nup50-like isoform X4 [Misgurnus anguillicaudatus]
MAKRIAEKELTDRNWDQEDENEEGESGGAFKAFKGFSLTPGGGTPSFSGFGNGAGFKPLSGLTNGSVASVAPSFAGFNSSTPAKTNSGLSTFISSKPTDGDVTSNGSASSSGSKEYNRQLTALNCSVRDWITKHVNDNPLCDLNPIFRDYERHLASIDKKYGSGTSDGAGESTSFGGEQKRLQSSAASVSVAGDSSSSAAPSLFSFKGKDAAAAEKPEARAAVPPGVSFKFGQKVDSSVLSSLGSSGAPSFSFSSSSSSGTSAFGAAAPAVSTSVSAASNSQTADENGEESDEPPVPVVKEIKEKDAFYSKKCKLFYKKDSEFKEKGVGTLHLKMVTDGKLQLLVRADTNLGNILLNIMVPSSMPCSRTGKNNVMVVCVPNPPVDEKNPSTPVPVLIRVKTSEDADELHQILQDKKA